MPSTAEEFYTQTIKTLSPSKRFRLATLILNDLVSQGTPAIDQSDTWSEQDYLDLANFLRYAVKQLPKN